MKVVIEREKRAVCGYLYNQRHDTSVYEWACICRLDMGNRVYADSDLAASVF
jgi:hypothetical protein